MQNFKNPKDLLKAIRFIPLYMTVLVASSSALAVSTALKQELLASKRVSTKIMTRLSHMSRDNFDHFQESENKEAYRLYWRIHYRIRHLHKRAVKKGNIGMNEKGQYSEELERQELKEFVLFMSKHIVDFSKLDAYERLSSSRKMYTSQIAASIETIIQYLREDDYIIALPDGLKRDLAKLSKLYKKQQKFLAFKEELLADYNKAKGLLEEELNKLEDNISKFIKVRPGPRKENMGRYYTDESYPYLKFKRLSDKVVDLLEDFDIDSIKEFSSINNKVLELKNVIKLEKANNSETKILLFRVNELFNNFAKEAKSLNSKLRPKKADLDFGVKTFKYDYYRATQVCSLLGGPGNILLRRSIESDIDLFEDFSPRTSGAIKLVEFLKFNDRTLDFRHAEIITEIERDTRITSMSFYPLSFNWGKDEADKMPPFLEIKKGYRHCNSSGCDTYNDYRTNFAWMRVNAKSYKKMTKRKEKALKKVENKEKYSKLGVCSDFVNWAYGNIISSNWNRIPVVRNILQFIYPPEGLQTPDNLYESYMTDVVCEVDNRELTYPQYVNAHHLKEQILTDMQSSNESVRNHAKKSLQDLIERGVIDEEMNLKYDIINFKTY